MQTITTKSGRVIRLPDETEEAAIQKGIVSDPDAREWTEEMFRDSKRFSDLPAGLQAKLRQGRGPQKAPRKVSTTIRLSPEVVQYFRATGEGWQTRINDALREWVAAR